MKETQAPSLNSSSFVPLYIQIANILGDEIKNNRLKAGQKLPSENDLIQQYGISRITAKAALNEMVKARLAYRKRGQGTFVATPLISDFSFFSSFSEDMRARGLEPSSRFISLEIEKPDDNTADKLKIDVDRQYYCLVRVRLANNEPVAVQKAYLPAEMYPNLGQHDFAISTLYGVMRSTYGFNPVWGEAIVEAGPASAEEAGYLGLKTGVPILIIWHLTLDDRYVPLEYVRSVYRSDRFSFSTGRNQLRDFRT